MNKKQLVLLVCLLVSLTFAAYAQQGGYRGPGTTPTTVEEAINLPHRAFVTLQGKIVRLVLPEEYLFSDGTGEITVLISDSKWRDVSVDENDTVEIQGIIRPRVGIDLWATHRVTVESIKKL